MRSMIVLFILTLGQVEPVDNADRRLPTVTRGADAGGVWPTQKMIRGFLTRWADDTAFKYDLDAEASAELRGEMIARWSGFVEEHRDTLRPLLNGYIESRVSPAPPDRESVREWGRLMRRVFPEFRRQMEETHQHIADAVGPDRVRETTIERLQFGAALDVLETKISRWERGEFKDTDWWQPTQRALHAARNSPAGGADSPKTPSRIDRELSSWDEFTAEFLAKYRLDGPQREAVFSILRECKQRAADHRDLYRARIARLERDMARSEKLTDVQEAELQLMYGPIDQLFAELRSRYDQIPTSGQTDKADKPVRNDRQRVDPGLSVQRPAGSARRD